MTDERPPPDGDVWQQPQPPLARASFQQIQVVWVRAKQPYLAFKLPGCTPSPSPAGNAWRKGEFRHHQDARPRRWKVKGDIFIWLGGSNWPFLQEKKKTKDDLGFDGNSSHSVDKFGKRRHCNKTKFSDPWTWDISPLILTFMFLSVMCCFQWAVFTHPLSNSPTDMSCSLMLWWIKNRFLSLNFRFFFLMLGHKNKSYLIFYPVTFLNLFIPLVGTLRLP